MRNVDVGWGISSACNMKCKFCYSATVRKNLEKNDVGLKEWIDFVDKNAANIDSINYGTGENSLLPDWYKLVKYISEHYPCITQAITTNGTLYIEMKKNPEYEEIIEKGIDEIDVSLDYAIEEKHDELRGLAGAYKNAINMLNWCKDRKPRATLVFIGIDDVIQLENLEGLFAIAKKADCKLRTNIFRPMNIQDKNLKQFIAKFDSIVKMLKWIDEKHNILYIGDPLFSSILANTGKISDPSGIKSVRILSNGDITPSTYLISEEFRNVNILNTQLDNIDENKMGLDYEAPDECVACKYSQKCGGGVLDRRYLWYNTFNTRDPYCPFRDENYLPDFEIRINPRKRVVESVHKDYLPTMFFEN